MMGESATIILSEIRLKVMESVQEDVNKGIVKIDSSFLRKIGANPGDVVEIDDGCKLVARGCHGVARYSLD